MGWGINVHVHVHISWTCTSHVVISGATSGVGCGGVLINVYVHVHTSLTREGWEVGVGKAKDTSAIGVVQSMQGLFVAAAPGFHRKELWKIHFEMQCFSALK